jgi:hypothetical protein
MPILGGGELFNYARNYRTLWIKGRYGVGKTLLGMEIVEWFLDQGYRLVTNTRCAWADNKEDIKPDVDGKLHVVLLLDEGGIFFGQNSLVVQMISYLRKMDVVLIIPSRIPPARLVRVMAVQPWMPFKSIGIPVVILKWRISFDEVKDEGKMVWYGFSKYYGIYSSNDPGGDGLDEFEWLVKQVSIFRARFGRESNKIRVVETEEAPYTDYASEEDVRGIISLAKRKS